MRYLLLCCLLVLTGCQNIVGPAGREPVRADDPRLPISEQERRGRAFLSTPNDSFLSGPQVFTPRTDSVPNQYK
jgi:hypothetical protein